VSHPSLGRPPRDLTAGQPAAAERLRADRHRLAARSIEIAGSLDPTFTTRHDDLGLRLLQRDLETYLERVALAVASNDPSFASQWAEWLAPTYRRRKVPMDDLVTLSEALRAAMPAALAPNERPAADAALDAAIAVFRWHRRLAGDARRRNRILAALYRGA
jgi:Phycobilisome protein